ncbi:MAG: GspE/PulE family protein [Pseudomonadota bacterium]
MPTESTDKYSVKAVCQVLIKQQLITREQAKAVLKREQEVLKDLVKKLEVSSQARGLKIVSSCTGIDVVAAMDFKRADNPNRDLDEETIFQAMSSAWGLTYKKIDPLKLNLNLVTTTIPRNFALKHLFLPIGIANGVLTVATPDPFNTEALEDVSRVTNLRVETVVSSKGDILRLIDEFFGFKRSIAMAEDLFKTAGPDLGNLEQYVKLSGVDDLPANDKHIVNAVSHLLVYAFDQRASDIHIEPKRETTRVRMRIDGVLHTVYQLPKKVHNPLVSRIKAMSRLDMAEKRRPQDGRIKTDRGGVEVEIRISTVPTAFGEKMVMRVMDPDILFQDLDGLGFTDEDKHRYNSFVNLPHGIALVCGPTGSGKSTTLYSTLRMISTSEKNVVTVEDPIEMVHEDFNQIGVQPSVGVTFATILRTLLRQDPDIIMVGETRDLETAQNAIQAALTGHLVLSTLHTNDAPTAVTRLLDLGVDAFLIQATLVGVLAQRLVRKICPYCMESFDITYSDLAICGLSVEGEGGVTLQRGQGCQRCRNTGYRGRIGVFEVMPYGDQQRVLTTPATDLDKLRKSALADGMSSLRESAIAKMIGGITTYQEVLRVTTE